jgi:hypothetical protein
VANIEEVCAALPGNPLGAGKHWGLFKVDRTAKEAMT